MYMYARVHLNITVCLKAYIMRLQLVLYYISYTHTYTYMRVLSCYFTLQNFILYHNRGAIKGLMTPLLSQFTWPAAKFSHIPSHLRFPSSFISKFFYFYNLSYLPSATAKERLSSKWFSESSKLSRLRSPTGETSFVPWHMQENRILAWAETKEGKSRDRSDYPRRLYI